MERMQSAKFYITCRALQVIYCKYFQLIKYAKIPCASNSLSRAVWRILNIADESMQVCK